MHPLRRLHRWGAPKPISLKIRVLSLERSRTTGITQPWDNWAWLKLIGLFASPLPSACGCGFFKGLLYKKKSETAEFSFLLELNSSSKIQNFLPSQTAKHSLRRQLVSKCSQPSRTVIALNLALPSYPRNEGNFSRLPIPRIICLLGLCLYAQERPQQLLLAVKWSWIRTDTAMAIVYAAISRISAGVTQSTIVRSTALEAKNFFWKI